MQNFPPHIVQSKVWGEFKTRMGTPAVRVGDVQFTLHKIPFIPYFVGYCPKVSPDNLDWLKLYKAGKESSCTHIKIDVPNTNKDYEPKVPDLKLTPTRPTFAENTLSLDLTKNEGELLKEMHHKTRYNIKLAQRHGVKIEEGKDERTVQTFLDLQRETARSQRFFIHPDSYYRILWEMLRPKKMAHILTAEYKGKPIVAYFLLRYKETFYYTYGGSSSKHKNVMASNLIMWESIRLGKRLGCKVFDMWGALSENPDQKDPWYGFHRFKQGYGGELVSFPSAWDLVIHSLAYILFKEADKLRWFLLRLR